MAEHDAGALSLCDRYAVADVDSHIIEPADLWTSRVPSKWGDLVPHVRFHERRQEDYWYVGDRKLYGVGAFAQAGWPEFPPSHPAGSTRPCGPPSMPRRASPTWTRWASTTPTSSASTATSSCTRCRTSSPPSACARTTTG